jgi:hypothetical protein
MIVTVPNTDDPFGCPIYDGDPADAWRTLPSGAYSATTGDGDGAVLLVIRSSHGTGSSAAHVYPTTQEV